MLHTNRMILVPEDLYLQMKNKIAVPKRDTPLEKAGEQTPEARQIHYTTNERRRRKLNEDQTQTPLLVDFPTPKTELLAAALTPKTETKVSPASRRRILLKHKMKREPKEEIKKAKTDIMPTVKEEQIEKVNSSTSAASTDDEDNESGEGSEKVREIMNRIRSDKPEFLAPNGTSILKTDGKVYKGGSLWRVLMHLHSQTTKKKPAGTDRVLAYLRQHSDLYTHLVPPQKGQGQRIGWFRPQLWTKRNVASSTTSIERPR